MADSSSSKFMVAGIGLLVVAVVIGGIFAFSSEPAADADGDETTAEAGASGEQEGGAKKARKVLREKGEAAEEPGGEGEEGGKEIALPGALPKLNVATSEENPEQAAPAEPAESVEGKPAEEAIQIRVSGEAKKVGSKCLQTVRKKFPGARGTYALKLMVGPSSDGATVVKDIGIEGQGPGGHPELLACLDRELMRMNLGLPEGQEGVVKTQLKMDPEPGQEGEAAAAAGAAADPAAHEPEGLPPGVEPHTPEPGEAVPPGEQPAADPATAGPAEPPPGAPPPGEAPPPEQPAEPGSGPR